MEPLGPFDGNDAVFVQKVQQPDFIRIHWCWKAVKVHMVKRQPAGVFVDQGIRGAGNRKG